MGKAKWPLSFAIANPPCPRSNLRRKFPNSSPAALDIKTVCAHFLAFLLDLSRNKPKISALYIKVFEFNFVRANMKDIAIFGAGGFGKEVACFINLINKSKGGQIWNFIGFFDDNEKLIGSEVSRYGKVLGTSETLNAWDKELDLAVAIGNPAAIKSVVQKIKNPNIDFPNLCPQNGFSVDDSYSIGKGNIIQGGSFLSCDVKIGNFNVLNGSVVFGHDVVVGDCNVFMPATRISGKVKIGDCNLFGVGSIVLQGLDIGNNIKLSPGSVLMAKPKDGNLYIGNPAKKFNY